MADQGTSTLIQQVTLMLDKVIKLILHCSGKVGYIPSKTSQVYHEVYREMLCSKEARGDDTYKRVLE